MERFTENKIVNLEFLNELPGVFCFKTDSKANIIAYACISSTYRLLIIKVCDMNNYEIYNWESDNSNVINEQKHVICEFLGELAIRPLLERGTTYEQKIANTFWQLFFSQESVPQEIIQIAKKEFGNI